MNKKKFLTGIFSFAAVVSLNITSFAGQWRQNETGWWYDNGNGTWPASSWQWIDGNQDGIAECYYFNKDGYCLMNAAAPDGSLVDANGAWCVNGSVQVRNIGIDSAEEENESPQKKALILYDQEPVLMEHIQKYESASTNKEHETWAKVFKSDSRLGGTASIEFYAGGQYDSFKASVAPSDFFPFARSVSRSNTDWKKDDIVIFQVLGSEDGLLYEADIDYRTSAFDIDVDISGQDSVTIYLMIEEGDLSPIIIKNARFE